MVGAPDVRFVAATLAGSPRVAQPGSHDNFFARGGGEGVCRLQRGLLLVSKAADEVESCFYLARSPRFAQLGSHDNLLARGGGRRSRAGVCRRVRGLWGHCALRAL